jgi:hypothetical protein
VDGPQADADAEIRKLKAIAHVPSLAPERKYASRREKGKRPIGPLPIADD